MTPLADIPRNKDGSLSRTALKKLSKSEDLRGIDLAGQDLGGQNLADLDLTGANLTDADLTRAKLWRANLTVANLTDTNLTDAGLRQANLTGANLRGANLRNTDLTGANLTGAGLNEVTGLNLSHNGINARGAVCCDQKQRFENCWAERAAADGHNQDVQDMISAFGRQENAGSYEDTLLTVQAILAPSR